MPKRPLGSIHTGRISANLRHKTRRAGFGTHVSQTEHSYRPRQSGATAACAGIRSIIDDLLKPRQGNDPIRSSSHVFNVTNDNRMMSAVNGMSAM